VVIMKDRSYEYLSVAYRDLVDRIKIPKFQRRLVWSEKKKRDLIETLHKGYPFGALLVAPNINNDKETLQLLDGQQRLSTINSYENNKVSYWKKLNEDVFNNLKEKINLDLADEGQSQLDDSEIEKLLQDTFDLADWTDRYEKMAKDKRRRLRDYIKNARKQIQTYIDLDKLQIPVMRFLGDHADLPEVFENLNKGGTPLNKYEVLSASWANATLTMPADDRRGTQILDLVKGYYQDMKADGEFEIDDFSEDEISSTRKINLAEFGRAFGTYVTGMIPALVGRQSYQVSNEIGFGLLGIIVGIDNRRLVDLNDHLAMIQKNIFSILEKAEKISNNLNSTFSVLFSQNISFKSNPKNPKSAYSTGLSTTFKVLSYFGALWEQDDLGTQISLKFIPQYYVYDFLTGAWTAHGDQRLLDYYPSKKIKNYENQLTKEQFESAFKNWLSENTGVRKTFSKEVKALITLHSNLTYLKGSVPYGEDFEFEHILPKARVLAYDTSLKNIHLSALGNGMFLPKTLNNNKKDKTLYEVDHDYSMLISKSSYPIREEMSCMLENLKTNKFRDVNEAIDIRGMKIAKQIVDGLLIEKLN